VRTRILVRLRGVLSWKKALLRGEVIHGIRVTGLTIRLLVTLAVVVVALILRRRIIAREKTFDGAATKLVDQETSATTEHQKRQNNAKTIKAIQPAPCPDDEAEFGEDP